MMFLDFKNVYLCITAFSLYKSGIIESLYTHPPRFISHKFPRQMTKSHRIDPDTHDTGNFVVSGMVVGYLFGWRQVGGNSQYFKQYYSYTYSI